MDIFPGLTKITPLFHQILRCSRSERAPWSPLLNPHSPPLSLKLEIVNRNIKKENSVGISDILDKLL